MAYIGNVPAEKYIALTQQTFSSPTGTSFTLSQAVTNPVDIDLYIDNVKQDPASYSVSGTSLTTSTIASPSTMYCIFNGKAMQTVNPPDDSVGLAQLAGGTDGNVITFDASGNPAYVATGSSGQVLTSAGAGAAPTFAAGGKVLQVVNVIDGDVATGTTVLPSDNTIAQNTEGDQFLSLAITPSNASNKLIIHVCITGGSSAVTSTGAALFQDSTANALAQSHHYNSQATALNNLSFIHYMAAGTTSATTFKVRCGGAGSNTFTFNGSGGTRVGGDVMASSITITEIAV